MDNAQLIFHQMLSEKYQRIDKFVTGGQEEHLCLDFKEKSEPARIGLSGDDKRNYAKALSGFSNAVGGVVVWGIRARRANDESPDIAQEIKPIKGVKRFLTDLNSLISDALIPVNSGVRNEAIFVEDNEANDEGFVVTYVPESQGLPHRAMCGLNIYYTRAGDSFHIMEHHLLADMFGRRQKPDLHIFYRMRKDNTGNEVKISVIVGIENKGRYLATYPAIRLKPIIRLNLSQFSVDGITGGWGLPVQIQPRDTVTIYGTLFAGGINNVIHPDTVLEVAVLNATMNFKRDQFVFGCKEKQVVFQFAYEIFCEGCQQKSGEIVILEPEVAELVES